MQKRKSFTREFKLEAVRLLKPKRVAPAHHSTWPVIAQDAAAWGTRVAAETSATPVILKPGESCGLTT